MVKILNNIGIVILLLLSFSFGCSDDINKEKNFLPDATEGNQNIEEINPFWGWVGTFPGWIDKNAPRVNTTPILIDGCYTKITKDSRIDFSESPWYSTGYYAAPGEEIVLVKPARLKTKVSWRIGAWKCELTAASLKRYKKVFETGEFKSDSVTIKSWFGGHVYIVADEPFARPETFLVKGAVKSPDFVLGETDPEQWKSEIQNTTIPYAELIGKRTIWTLPLQTLKKITNPAGLLELYDDIIENDFNGFHGFSELPSGINGHSPDYPVRIVQDVELCKVKGSHTGYPVMIDHTEANLGIDVDEMRSTSVAWNFYKEVGRNYQTWCWSWNGVKEVVNMLPYYHSRARMLGSWPAVRNESDEVNKGPVRWEFVIRDYVLKNDPNKNHDNLTEGQRMMPFVQLAQQYGWKLYAYIGECSRALPKSSIAVLKILGSQPRIDFFCKRVCEYANADMRPFFDAWGIKYSTVAGADMAAMPAYSGEKFWEKWESNKMPDFEPRTPSSIKLSDDNYNDVVSALDQTQWVVDSSSGTTEGSPEFVINGLMGKDDKTAYYWGSQAISRRPDYPESERPWIAFDMKKVSKIYEGYIRLRNWTGNWRGQPKIIRVYIKMQAEDEWEFLDEIETARDVTKIQHFVFANMKSGRYIKIVLVQGHAHTSGQSDGGYGVSLDEFWLGGTMPISISDYENMESDPDFPRWN